MGGREFSLVCLRKPRTLGSGHQQCKEHPSDTDVTSAGTQILKQRICLTKQVQLSREPAWCSLDHPAALSPCYLSPCPFIILLPRHSDALSSSCLAMLPLVTLPPCCYCSLEYHQPEAGPGLCCQTITLP